MRSFIRQLLPRPAALRDDALHVGFGTTHHPHQAGRSVLHRAFPKLYRGDKRGGLHLDGFCRKGFHLKFSLTKDLSKPNC